MRHAVPSHEAPVELNYEERLKDSIWILDRFFCKLTASHMLHFLKGVFEHSKKFQKSWSKVGFL